jgi:hypothetical protein
LWRKEGWQGGGLKVEGREKRKEGTEDLVKGRGDKVQVREKRGQERGIKTKNTNPGDFSKTIFTLHPIKKKV